MSPILQYIFSGLTVGAIYGLVAVGFNIMFNSASIMNFAQGQFVVLGGLIMVTLTTKLGIPMIVAFVMTLAAVVLIAAVLERACINPARDGTQVTLIIITIGLAVALEGGATVVWGKEAFTLPPFSGDEPIRLLGATLMPQTLWIMGVTGLMASLLALFLNRTIHGKAVLATAADKAAAELVGIDTRRIVLLTFCISAGLGATAGIVLTPLVLIDSGQGFMFALKGFAAAALGGMGNAPGALAAGFLLGIAEALGAGLLTSAYKDVIALAVLLLSLFIRPAGLLGKTSRG